VGHTGHYIAFIFAISLKPKAELTGPEQYVAEELKHNRTEWFPAWRSIDPPRGPTPTPLVTSSGQSKARMRTFKRLPSKPSEGASTDYVGKTRVSRRESGGLGVSDQEECAAQGSDPAVAAAVQAASDLGHADVEATAQ
jgi:hypothetical protein